MLNAFNFLTKEAKEGPILLKHIQKRVSQAIGVSLGNVQRILKEMKNNNSTGFSTPCKKHVLKKPKTSIDDFDKSVKQFT